MTGVLTCLGRDPRLLRGGGAISIISSEPERWLSLQNGNGFLMQFGFSMKLDKNSTTTRLFDLTRRTVNFVKYLEHSQYSARSDLIGQDSKILMTHKLQYLQSLSPLPFYVLPPSFVNLVPTFLVNSKSLNCKYEVTLGWVTLTYNQPISYGISSIFDEID